MFRRNIAPILTVEVKSKLLVFGWAYSKIDINGRGDLLR
jgi:hypothetical protein